MRITCIGSSSRGNGYVLHNDREALIMEAGFRYTDVRGITRVPLVGCIVTHRHKDHSRYIKEYVTSGVHTYAPACVIGEESTFAHYIIPTKGFNVGGFRIVAFNVEHDVECVGYTIAHKEMGKLLFLTDTMYSRYKFKNLNHIMVEANYSTKILEENIKSGITNAAMASRLTHSHMELGTTIKLLKNNDLSQVKEIILLHLSDKNSNATDFACQVQAATGKPAYIAITGFEKELIP